MSPSELQILSSLLWGWWGEQTLVGGLQAKAGPNQNLAPGAVWWKRHACMLNCVQHFGNPWTVACQAPLFMGFPSKECWSGLPFPPLGDISDTWIELVSPALAGRLFTSEPLGRKWICSRSQTRILSSFSCVWLSATLWTVAHPALLSTGFSWQECWSGLPWPRPSWRPRGRTCNSYITCIGKQILYH